MALHLAEAGRMVAAETDGMFRSLVRLLSLAVSSHISKLVAGVVCGTFKLPTMMHHTVRCGLESQMQW